jgi:hypothetical protein
VDATGSGLCPMVGFGISGVNDCVYTYTHPHHEQLHCSFNVRSILGSDAQI